MISKTSSARPIIYLKVKALKEQEELQSRLEKLKRAATQREIADLHADLFRKAGTAEIERKLAEASSSQGTSFRSIPPVDSFTEDSGWMDKSETAENGAKSIIALSKHSTPKISVKSSPCLGETRNFQQKPLGKVIGKTEQKLITEHADKEQHLNQT